MTTTTMQFQGQRIAGASRAAGRRRSVRRPTAHRAPWITPLAWMAVLALFVAGVGAVALLRDGVPSGAPATISVRVAPSDSLWSIARANRLPGASTAATVEAITRANDLRSSSLTPGTVLLVPAYGASGAAFAQANGSAVDR